MSTLKAIALGAALAIAAPAMASATYYSNYQSYSGPTVQRTYNVHNVRKLMRKYIRHHYMKKYDLVKHSHYGKRPWMKKRHYHKKPVSNVPLPAGGLLLLTGLGGLAVIRARKKAA